MKGHDRDLVSELEVPKYTAQVVLSMIDLAADEDSGVFVAPDGRALNAALRRGLLTVDSEGSYCLATLAYEWAKQYRRTLFRVIQGGRS